MKLITAVVRSISLDRTVKALEKIGIMNVSISPVKGLGEQIRMHDPYTIHEKLVVIVPDEQAETVVKTITENTRTGLSGDGIIAVAHLDYAVKIRTEEKLH